MPGAWQACFCRRWKQRVLAECEDGVDSAGQVPPTALYLIARLANQLHFAPCLRPALRQSCYSGVYCSLRFMARRSNDPTNHEKRGSPRAAHHTFGIVESGGWTTQSLAPPSGKRDVDYFIGRKVRSEGLVLKQAYERSAEVARKRCKDMRLADRQGGKPLQAAPNRSR